MGDFARECNSYRCPRVRIRRDIGTVNLGYGTINDRFFPGRTSHLEKNTRSEYGGTAHALTFKSLGQRNECKRSNTGVEELRRTRSTKD
jgi:hypothetical protein